MLSRPWQGVVWHRAPHLIANGRATGLSLENFAYTSWHVNLRVKQFTELLEFLYAYTIEAVRFLFCQGLVLVKCNHPIYNILIDYYIVDDWTTHIKEYVQIKLDRISPIFGMNISKKSLKPPPSTYMYTTEVWHGQWCKRKTRSFPMETLSFFKLWEVGAQKLLYFIWEKIWRNHQKNLTNGYPTWHHIWSRVDTFTNAHHFLLGYLFVQFPGRNSKRMMPWKVCKETKSPFLTNLMD